MRKLSVLCAIALLQFNLGAQGKSPQQPPPQPSAAKNLDARWEQVAWSEDGNFIFIDKKTVTKDSGTTRFWMCEVFSESSVLFNAGLHRRVSRFEYDTIAGMIRITGVSTYGPGDKVATTNLTPSSWGPIPPGSLFEMLAEKVK